MAWTIYWDNGIDCGTFGQFTFQSEDEAISCADSITKDYIAEGIWDESGFAEAILIEEEIVNGEADSIVEQSYEYFDRYIAGDR